MENQTIEMAALGRPLYPGMLYDCCRDTFIPGVTLWDTDSLHKNLDVHPQPKTDTHFCASDSLSDKANLLDISASLKASFLGGLVEVGGSAKYMCDKKSSARQSRVTMKYSQTTTFEQLTMTQLGKIIYPQVFDDKTATHVVTAVLYGGQAFMVFDQMASEEEDIQEIEGNLNVMVRKIPLFSIEGSGSVKMTEKEKNQAENISCTFYGDYEIDQNPTTYLEAISLYKKLPSLLKQKEEDAVPVKVWLYPLAHLDKKAASLEREISMTLLTKIENLLEELEDVERRCNDLAKNATLNMFYNLKERLDKFQDLFVNYKVLFQKALCRLLPAIRGGEEKEEALCNILTIHNSSPYIASNLNQWIDNLEGEINLLNLYIKELKAVPVMTSSIMMNNVLFDPNIDTVVCFSFTSLKYEDPYLSSLHEFLKVDEYEKLEKSSQLFVQDTQAWYQNPELSERMKDNLALFSSFYKANELKDKTKFVIASVSDPSYPGTSIRLYKKGNIVDGNFQPVSKPAAPRVVIQDRNVILNLQKSPTGTTLRYKVEYRTTKPPATRDDVDAWTVSETPDAQENFTLTGLPLADQYWVRFRAVGEAGQSEASDPVQFTCPDKINVSIGQSWDLTIPPLFKELKKKLTTFSTSYWSLSTIQSEVTNQINNPNISYVGTIPGGIKAGMALYFQGIATANAIWFSINLKLGPKDEDDTAFHFNPRIQNNTVVWDSCRNRKWENQQRTVGRPITQGSAFDIFFVVKTERYEAYVNGQRYFFFKHRMPVEKVTTLYINGQIVMSIIGIVENWSTSTFGKEQSSGTSRGKLSNIQSGVPHPVCNPSKPYMGPIPGGLRPGLALYFDGVTPSDSCNIQFNFKTGPSDGDDIPFHFNPRVWSSSVVRAIFRNNNWEHEEETAVSPFAKGGFFDMFIVVKGDCYEVIVNGISCCTYQHYMPLEKVTTLNICGDVFVNTFAIVKVDDVNLRMTKVYN